VIASLQFKKIHVTFNVGKIKVKSKVIPETGRGCPKGFEMLIIPHFLDNLLTDGSEAVSLTGWLPFTSSKYFLALIPVRG
jgi:hypothetical protein